MDTVLVTGASGFIGRHCLPVLARNGFVVEAVSLHAENPAGPGAVRWHEADLLDAAGTRDLIRRLRPSHLLHLAWYAVPGKYWTAPENKAWFHASVDLFREFAAAGGRRIVAAGSCAEYDWSHGVCNEATTPLAPATPYGAAKHALQVELSALSVQAGLSAAWARIFFLYGPHEHPDRLIPSVIRALIAGEPARCTEGSQVRDFLHVEDAADALVALLRSSVTGAVNIGSGEGLAIRSIVSRIAARMRAQELLRLGALPQRPDEPASLVADIKRLSDELGWKPRFDLDRGLDDTIEWWKSEKANRVEQT
jgi:nucleoside-diphosphate-sugar epimerase